jgi:hypothetical protein
MASVTELQAEQRALLLADSEGNDGVALRYQRTVEMLASALGAAAPVREVDLELYTLFLDAWEIDYPSLPLPVVTVEQAQDFLAGHIGKDELRAAGVIIEPLPN